jgi:NAD+ diphosphatase
MNFVLEPPGFTGNPLDRLDHVRDDSAAFAALKSDTAARLLLLEGLDPVLTSNNTLSWAALHDVPPETQLALLGMIDGFPRFVPLQAGEIARKPAWQLFKILGDLPGDQAAIYATARSLVDWHNRHTFCANCGTQTTPERAGWSRKCGRCDAQHFPRTDPVVIMLAEYDDKILVGRQPQFPANRYSALAGFLEVGESIEEAVARELLEEAGVTATSVRYIASQPWPFPSSLMVACIATVSDDKITLDTNELEDAIWCTRAEIKAVMAGEPGARFVAPPPYAIAYTLLTRWAAGA